jgi:hypothetical protein
MYKYNSLAASIFKKDMLDTDVKVVMGIQKS